MGYQTELDGCLTFNKEKFPKAAPIINLLNQESFREHPEWKHDAYYIQFKLNKNGDGIIWDGSEKFYNIPEAVNIIIDEIRKYHPDFSFEGKIFCQGEDIGDVWWLKINPETGYAESYDIIAEETTHTCPKCGHKF